MKKVEQPVKRIQQRLQEDSSSSSPEPMQVVPLPSWEDMFLQELKMMRHVEQKDKEKGYLPNPYRYNLRGYSPKPPLGSSPLKNMGQPDDIKEKISYLEEI
jgi:hypothetical protein